uniref:S-acyltransferase n=1 Tax=Anthurium amnicola TaxID=1678845 RepID=A0A1D1YZH4_9ARAE
MVGRKGRRFLSLPVVAVIALMGFVHYFTVYVFIEDWLSLGSSAGFYNALVFSFLALMSLASFFAAVLVDPGHVPASFVPDTEGSQGNGVRLKYCDRCCSYKPPRSHHCRVCRMCVLKMDHHCLWINNCVGYANYKPFVIFVLYASSSSIYSMVMFVCSTLQNDHKFIGRASLEYFHVSTIQFWLVLLPLP